MSHNKIKVAGQSPNSSGNITLNLDDVSSVSTPSDDQILLYENDAFTNSEATWLAEHAESSRTISGGHNITNGNTVPIPRTNLPAGEQYFFAFAARRINEKYYMNVSNTANSTITEVALNANADYYYKVVLNTAGVYRLFAKLAIGELSPDNASLEVQWSNADNSVTYGPRVRLKNKYQKLNHVIGYINASGGESVGFYKHANNNSAEIPAKYYENHLIVIEKIG